MCTVWWLELGSKRVKLLDLVLVGLDTGFTNSAYNTPHHTRTCLPILSKAARNISPHISEFSAFTINRSMEGLSKREEYPILIAVSCLSPVRTHN